MLTVFYGSDTDVVRSTALAQARAYTDNGYELQRLDALNYESGKLADLAEGVSLFGTPHVYVLDMPTAVSDFWTELVSLQEVLAEAVDPYIVIEGPLTASEKKELRVNVSWQEAKAETGTKRFDTFRLANALIARDKRTLWITFHEARAAGIAAEEMIGILWWQLKVLRLAQMTNSAAEAGLKEFPYRKAKQALNKFSESQILRLMQSLLAVYHDGHGGERDIINALEQWILHDV